MTIIGYNDDDATLGRLMIIIWNGILGIYFSFLSPSLFSASLTAFFVCSCSWRSHFLLVVVVVAAGASACLRSMQLFFFVSSLTELRLHSLCVVIVSAAFKCTSSLKDIESTPKHLRSGPSPQNSFPRESKQTARRGGNAVSLHYKNAPLLRCIRAFLEIIGTSHLLQTHTFWFLYFLTMK